MVFSQQACIFERPLKPRTVKKLLLSIILGGFLFLPAHAATEAAGDTLNLASKAIVTTSFVSGWEKLAAVNDGLVPAASNTKTVIAYGNWDGSNGKTNWVQYEWPQAQHLLSTSVFWWYDGSTPTNGGINLPTTATISYWDGIVWQNAGDIGKTAHIFNTKALDIFTSKIRISMSSSVATGIFEWRVSGIESGPCPATPITAYTQIGSNGVTQANTGIVMMGDSVTFDPQADGNGKWGWTGPNGFTVLQRKLTLRDLMPAQSGTYTASYINDCGSVTKQYFHLTVDSIGNPGDAMVWPKYNPTLNYNFRDEFPALAVPTKELPDASPVAGSMSSGWWTFKWGPKKKSLIDTTAIIPMLARMNQDFAYFRDSLGWPPDLRAKNGYRSTIYLYGSGLNTDNADSTALGGWQSAMTYGGISYPMVLISYYPVYSFSPKCTYSDKIGQQGAVVHEGIHAVLADLPGCKSSAWYQEGGNTWLQQEMESRKSKNYSSMGFLNAGTFIAPFMPIECYSGWLQDDSFGGPAAEGVNMTNASGAQLCTWRNLLGGVQYSNIFPTFLGMTLGSGSVAWTWRNCPGRVLEGMSVKLGDRAMRRLITEYRAKQAMLDMGLWTNATKALLDANFGGTIQAEWQPSWKAPAAWIASPYVRTTTSPTGLITPEYRTTPGWSGANQIPLAVTGNEVVVNFQPLAPNMTCQLCYRTRSGTIVYSKVVNGGDCTLKLTSLPANNVVIAVICNTDYIYEGDTTRKKHFDYRLQKVKGVTTVAQYNAKWYSWTTTIAVDVETPKASVAPLKFKNPVRQGEDLELVFDQPLTAPTEILIRNLYGQVVFRQQVDNSTTLPIGRKLIPGLYMVSSRCSGKEEVQKLIVK
jgi:hypothetical protein